jgi:hypothetical protein
MIFLQLKKNKVNHILDIIDKINYIVDSIEVIM